VIAINNDSRSAELDVDVSRAGLGNGVTLTDRLGALKQVQVLSGKIKLKLPERSAAILVQR
jgi:hypothetical protein